MRRNLGIGSWIARRAQMTPERVALVHEDKRLSYRQLDARVARVARALERLGVGPGDRVAFLGHNHPAALETLFACGLLRAIAVLLHPGFDDAALVQVLRDAAPSVVIVTPELSAAAQRIRRSVGVRTWLTTGSEAQAHERLEDLILGSSGEPFDYAVGLEDTALLAFSSGTTGPSKGVRLTHGNLLFNALNTVSALDYHRDDVILTSAPLYRMGGLGFTLAMLFQGGTAVLQERADPELSLRAIERHRVTVLFDAVGALRAMSDAPAFWSRDLSSLRVCATGGSSVPPSLVEAFRRRGLCLQPGYGLTEAAPLVLLVDRDEVEAHPGAVGRAVMFCDVRVVDAELADVAPGEVGELLVAGPNVTPGYWGDPLATARALSGGWLRTGDAARAGADGMIHVVGRVGDALVLGGRLVHPGPIEEALCQEPGVLECALVQAAPEARPELCVVLAPGARFERERVYALCRTKLGGAADPELRAVASLPKNPNGKLLRNQLTTRGTAPEAGVSPWGRARRTARGSGAPAPRRPESHDGSEPRLR